MLEEIKVGVRKYKCNYSLIYDESSNDVIIYEI